MFEMYTFGARSTAPIQPSRSVSPTDDSSPAPSSPSIFSESAPPELNDLCAALSSMSSKPTGITKSSPTSPTRDSFANRRLQRQISTQMLCQVKTQRSLCNLMEQMLEDGRQCQVVRSKRSSSPLLAPSQTASHHSRTSSTSSSVPSLDDSHSEHEDVDMLSETESESQTPANIPKYFTIPVRTVDSETVAPGNVVEVDSNEDDEGFVDGPFEFDVSLRKAAAPMGIRKSTSAVCGQAPRMRKSKVLRKARGETL